MFLLCFCFLFHSLHAFSLPSSSSLPYNPRAHAYTFLFLSSHTSSHQRIRNRAKHTRHTHTYIQLFSCRICIMKAVSAEAQTHTFHRRHSRTTPLPTLLLVLFSLGVALLALAFYSYGPSRHVQVSNTTKLSHSPASTAPAQPSSSSSLLSSSPLSTPLSSIMSGKIILETFALGRTPYKTFNPFLFCMHHNDAYPVGENDHLGPNPRFLRGRDIGMDFSYQDGWSMYHGKTVPGFPEHPHRGFETITVVNKGFVDHSDSIKCTARYGNGDTQWMTAGKGIQHAEMFPLLSTAEPNTLNLFQIWLNLPKRNKFCEPYFGMIWDEVKPIAHVPVEGATNGKTVDVQVIAGDLYEAKAQPPPPSSWAADANNDVAVWVMDIPAGDAITLPAARCSKDVTRALYVVSGDRLELGAADAAETLAARKGARIAADRALRLKAVGAAASVLLLQGRPIDEPVVQHGPFVMNTREEIMQCFADFQRTGFGGWPWTSSDHCHTRDTPRHAVHPDGHRELPPNKGNGEKKA